MLIVVIYMCQLVKVFQKDKLLQLLVQLVHQLETIVILK